MKTLSYSHIGHSHIQKGIPCQDASSDLSSQDCFISVVSDGHGWPGCFRSDVGSEIAVRIANEKIQDFVHNSSSGIFETFPFTQRESGMSYCKSSDPDASIYQLLSSIVTAWGDEVESYSINNPVIPSEIVRYSQNKDDARIAFSAMREFIDAKGRFYEGLYDCYGCTLIASVITPDYWFAFHIGDGKCFSLKKDGTMIEPVSWDSKCYENVTTSLCGKNPLLDFRYSFGGKETIPDAVFLCSDGLEDSYVEEHSLEEFFIKSLKIAREQGADELKNLYRELFPELSRDCNINRDDISVSMIYSE